MRYQSAALSIQESYFEHRYSHQNFESHFQAQQLAGAVWRKIGIHYRISDELFGGHSIHHLLSDLNHLYLGFQPLLRNYLLHFHMQGLRL